MEKSFFDTLSEKSALRSLLLGNVPDVNWQLQPTPRLKRSFQVACESWECLSTWFALAGRNRRCRVPLMPVLSFIALIGGEVASLPLAVEIISSSPLANNQIEPRVYSAWTGHLREMAVGLYLSQFGTVFKNPYQDLNNGVDWIFNGQKIAIAHEGRTSAKMIAARKLKKTDQDTIVLTAAASFSSRLDFCTNEEILAKIRL
jgi:hypothetical protein